MGEVLRGKRGQSPQQNRKATELGDRNMFLTEDIDDAHGPTSPEQPSEPECNFFGIAGTLRASLLLWSLGLGLSACSAPNLCSLQLRGGRLAKRGNKVGVVPAPWSKKNQS